jgi:class 3 adenylate cyclase
MKPTGHHGGRLRFAPRLAWGLALVAVVLGLGTSVLVVLTGTPLSEVIAGHTAVGVMVGLGFPPLGALIVARHPRHPIGWLLLVAGLTQSLVNFAGLYATYALQTRPGSLPGGPLMAWLNVWMWAPGYGILLAGLPLLFPTGRLPSQRWRPVAWLAGVALFGIIAPIAIVTWPLRGLRLLADAPPDTRSVQVALVISIAMAVVLVGVGFAAVVSLVVRLRRAGTVERQQIKWYAYASVLSVVIVAVSGVFPALVWLELLAIPCVIAGLVMALFRYRLYDIDWIISRTLVYGLLTAAFTAVYLAIVVGIGTLLGAQGRANLVLSVAATGVIAVAFQPARDRSRRLANRLVYGRRATPYEVLSAFSRGVTGASADDSLQRMARLVVEATGAVQATVWLRFGDLLQPQAGWPQDGPLPEPIALEGRGVQEALAATQATSRSFPVGHEDELLGALTVRPSPAEPLTPAGEKLIGDLATQTGLGLRFQRMKERALFARALASFLPPEVADLVEASPSALSLREELEATVVFSDIRGFSSLAERLAPREVAEVVGRHLAAMVEVVTGHGGVLDKFAGDAVMAVFGAPRPASDHARRALACAAAMQRRQLALNQAAQHAALPAFQIGVGINTGAVIAGTLGGPGRLDYTVLGDAVNVAQRLQSEAVGGEILAAAVTVREAGTELAESVGSKQLKGRQELVDVYRIRWLDVPTAQQPGATAHAE